jgi:putative flippase GtrA
MDYCMKQRILWLIFHKDHAGLQFLKYLVCGGIGAASDLLTFYALVLFVFPAVGEGDFLVKWFGDIIPVPSDPSLIGRNFIFASIGAFIISGIISYLLNIWFVFHSDARSRHREVLLFLFVSAANILLGTTLGWCALKLTGITSIGYLAKMGGALIINFLGRKYLVFRAAPKL